MSRWFPREEITATSRDARATNGRIATGNPVPGDFLLSSGTNICTQHGDAAQDIRDKTETLAGVMHG